MEVYAEIDDEKMFGGWRRINRCSFNDIESAWDFLVRNYEKYKEFNKRISVKRGSSNVVNIMANNHILRWRKAIYEKRQ